jgi:hypothetical protein
MAIGLIVFTVFQKERIFRGELSVLTSSKYYEL